MSRIPEWPRAVIPTTIVLASEGLDASHAHDWRQTEAPAPDQSATVVTFSCACGRAYTGLAYDDATVEAWWAGRDANGAPLSLLTDEAAVAAADQLGAAVATGFLSRAEAERIVGAGGADMATNEDAEDATS